MPDPEDPRTFERSKLTRQADQGLARLYRELIAARKKLPRGTPREIEYDERFLWLVVRRGPFELACNFGSGPVSIPCQGETIELSAGGDAHLSGGSLKLPPMAGALVQ